MAERRYGGEHQSGMQCYCGSSSITLLDGSNNTVYTADLKANGTYTSSVGLTGTWTIRIAMSDATGTLNFRVQKL